MKFSKLDKINHIFQQTPIAHVTIDPSLEIEKNKNLMLDPIGDYNCLTTAVIFQEIYRVLEEANLTLEELKHPVKKYLYPSNLKIPV